MRWSNRGGTEAEPDVYAESKLGGEDARVPVGSSGLEGALQAAGQNCTVRRLESAAVVVDVSDFVRAKVQLLASLDAAPALQGKPLLHHGPRARWRGGGAGGRSGGGAGPDPILALAVGEGEGPR